MTLRVFFVAALLAFGGAQAVFAKDHPLTANYQQNQFWGFVQHIEDLLRQNEKEAAIKEINSAIDRKRFSEKYTPNLYALMASVNYNIVHDAAAAEKNYLKALETITDETPDKDAIKMHAHFYLGMMQDNRGESEEAAKHLLAGLAIAKETKNNAMIKDSLIELVVLYMNFVDADQMTRYYNELEEFLEPQGGVEKNTSFNFLANVKLVQKKYDEALKYSLMGSGGSVLMGGGANKAQNFDTLASIYLAKKEYDKALLYSEQTITIPNESPLSRGFEYKTYGDVLIGLGRKQEACKAWKTSSDSFRAAGNERKRSQVQLSINEHCGNS